MSTIDTTILPIRTEPHCQCVRSLTSITDSRPRQVAHENHTTTEGFISSRSTLIADSLENQLDPKLGKPPILINGLSYNTHSLMYTTDSHYPRCKIPSSIKASNTSSHFYNFYNFDNFDQPSSRDGVNANVMSLQVVEVQRGQIHVSA
jgi:hypothetical protein